MSLRCRIGCHRWDYKAYRLALEIGILRRCWCCDRIQFWNPATARWQAKPYFALPAHINCRCVEVPGA